MLLDERLAGTRLLTTAVWVFSLDQHRILWANPAALVLWRAASIEELSARDLSFRSEAGRTRAELIHDTLVRGRLWKEELTLYPRDVPVRVQMTITRIDLDDGKMGWICEGHEKVDIDPHQLRGVEALKHTSVLVAVVATSGEVLMRNYATQQAFGDGETMEGWFVDATIPATLLRAVEEGQVFRAEVEVITLEGPRFHGVEARASLDPATGAITALIQQYDLTQRRERDALIEQQRQEILALSAPILEVGHRTLAVPIVGQLDRGRGAQLTEALLTRVVEQQAESVILDLTGAMEVTPADLLALLRALTLLGARPIVTGIHPSMARELITSEGSLEGVHVLRNLRQGIAACAAQPRPDRDPERTRGAMR
ncbi:STAS domain-containing protein [Chondromyces apiculatus]|uniref:RsbR, positive regulator of sigma-B n=1 Tax=Chondromyces apiculatus DSM 436 TaxID=1192034 RepID=A0A017T351_9BACT|nr:STAS domain-containing protein [Chondromyces apiculatus]EYF03422.1 RsbR, positive regulator of sigma-B [Chondromyces apiculatus DSM 436]